MLTRHLTARAPQRPTSLAGRETVFPAPSRAGKRPHELFSPALFGAGRPFHAWATTLFSYAVNADRSLSGRFCIFPLLAPHLESTHCDCSSWFERNCTFLSTVFSAYTMKEIWHLTHSDQQRCCPLYWRQRNTASGRIDLTRHPLRRIGALKNTHRSMRSYPFSDKAPTNKICRRRSG